MRRANERDHDAVVAVQLAAYARNRELLGVEPLPLMVDYHDVLRDKQVWLALAPETFPEHVAGVLVLEPRAGDMMIESVATHPIAQGQGLGRWLLAFAEDQARTHGLAIVRLYTGTILTHLVEWYGRHGYTVEGVEALSDRSRTNMMKLLSA